MKKILITLLLLAIYGLYAIPLFGFSFSSEQIERYKSQIYNVSIPEELEGSNTVIIGHRYWQKMDLKESVFPLPQQLNNLVRYYHYESNLEDKEYQGEVYLRIYDLENDEREKVNRELLYKEISYSFLNLKDSVITWKATNSFKPFPAFEYSYFGFITQEEDSSYKSHNLELKVILANDRAYFFIFCSKNLEGNDKFDKSCITLIKDVDIWLHYQEELAEKQAEKEKEELSEKRIKENSIVLFCGLLIFMVASWHIRKKNKYAQKWAIYTIVLYLLGLLGMGADILLRPYQKDTLYWLWLCYVPSTILDSVIVWYLKKCSSYEYQEYYLIPKFLLRNPFFNINNNYKKRIFMIGLIYPFFIIVPIPVGGLFFFICYTIPISTFFIITQGIINLMSWVKEGKALDNKSIKS